MLRWCARAVCFSIDAAMFKDPLVELRRIRTGFCSSADLSRTGGLGQQEAVSKFSLHCASIHTAVRFADPTLRSANSTGTGCVAFVSPDSTFGVRKSAGHFYALLSTRLSDCIYSSSCQTTGCSEEITNAKAAGHRLDLQRCARCALGLTLHERQRHADSRLQEACRQRQAAGTGGRAAGAGLAEGPRTVRSSVYMSLTGLCLCRRQC